MRRFLIPFGLALAILGWYAPWVTTTRQLAALTYNALDLTELCKFINRAGTANITREWFLVPLSAAALALALWANRAGPLPRPVQVAFTLLAAAFSLVPLPPYPFMLKAYASVEDRISFGLSLGGLLSVMVAFIFGRFLAGRWRAGVYIGLALIGTVPAALELITRALPAISKVYGWPVVLTWGFSLMLTGFACIVIGAVWRERRA